MSCDTIAIFLENINVNFNMAKKLDADASQRTNFVLLAKKENFKQHTVTVRNITHFTEFRNQTFYNLTNFTMFKLQ